LIRKETAMSTATVARIARRDLKALHGISMSIEGKPFVAIPLAILKELLKPAANETNEIPEGSVDAIPFMQATLAKNLKAARLEVRLTQDQIAERLKVTQPRISQAEGGHEPVGVAFVKRWLKACGLPEDWKPRSR